ncbi:MAG: PGPGW domain-containing protein [Pirellulales bacterium]
MIANVTLLAALPSLMMRALHKRQNSSWGRFMDRLARGGYRQARRIVIAVVGTTVLLVGVAMMLLPGPAIVVIPLGLAILAVEFAWARRWLRHVKHTAGSMRDRMVGRARSTSKENDQPAR